MSEVPTLLTADSPTLGSAFGPQMWGIYGQNGQPVLVSESVAAVEYTREYDISNYPQERGAFESYNKVQVPFQAKVTLLSNQTRVQLLNTLEPVVYSLSLVSVVTPEITYPSANLTRYSLRRTSQSGVTLIAVDIWCEEVRVDAGTQVSSVSSQNTGTNGAGTPAPIGQPSPGANLSAGSTPTGNTVTYDAVTQSQIDNQTVVASAPIPPASAINSASTNAASPAQSGPVQPITDVGSAAAYAPLSIPF